ncbi:hypothetical protein O9929_19775 [Vibrio lentus]|nr:hypothetical protein [Vibrio lentus]
MLCWTFPREDISRKEITNQLAFVLKAMRCRDLARRRH